MVKLAQKPSIAAPTKSGKKVLPVRKSPVDGKAWRRAAIRTPLLHPKKAVAQPWPIKDLKAYDFPDEMGWGPLLKSVLKKRGWSVEEPCHSHEDDKSTVMWPREFEAMVRQQDPVKLFGKRGAVQDGHRLRKMKLPPKALWLQACSDYRLPGDTSKACTREDFAKLYAKHHKTLPGELGDYRLCGFPGVYNALAKTDFSWAFRHAPWYPKAYCLPAEKEEILKRFQKSPNEYWVTKPRNDCSGVGICVMKANDPTLIQQVRAEKQASIVQRYIADPVLMGGYKFHMRIHLVVTSLSPPEAYVQAGGQCLFCTKPYTLAPETLGWQFDAPVHLSNTGLNMDNAQKDCFMAKKPVIGQGQQVSVSQLEKHLEKNYPRFKREEMWGQIMQISKEVVEYMAQAPGISRHGKFGNKQIFDLFGMDLMIDKDLKIWMCETNNTPGLDDQDKKVWGKPNPDYHKEHKCFEQFWNDVLTLLGLDGARKQEKGTLKNFYQIQF